MKKVTPKSKIAQIIAERGKVYGDPKHSHVNIGLSWTGLIQQHYGITLDHPIPASLVAQMLVNFKMQRASRVFHDDEAGRLAFGWFLDEADAVAPVLHQDGDEIVEGDNFDDGHAYLQFAQEFQQQEQAT